MQSHGIEFIQKDNCFTWVSDVEKTNELAGQQVKFNFSKVFDRIAQSINPIFDELFPQGEKYYWTLTQSVWAQDVLFKNTESLNNVYTDIIKKVNKTHRYEVTKNGIKIISALNIFETSKVETIMKMAA